MSGILAPRTKGQADRKGLPEIKIDLENLTAEEKDHWIFFGSPGRLVKKGAIAAVRKPDEVYPGTVPGSWIVCYYDEFGTPICHEASSPAG